MKYIVSHHEVHCLSSGGSLSLVMICVVPRCEVHLPRLIFVEACTPFSCSLKVAGLFDLQLHLQIIKLSWVLTMLTYLVTSTAQLVVHDSPAGRLGLTVCYDLRFPEVYQTLAWSMGAEVLLVPSAFTKITGAAHWEILLRARAIECQSYVMAAAQAGVHNEKRESYGHALIVDPWGEVIGRLEDPVATGQCACCMLCSVGSGCCLSSIT